MNRNHIRDVKLKREKRINEIVEYIIAHNGPDKDGMGHPIKCRLKYSELDAALTIAQGMSFCKDVKPYHFFNTMQIYENSWITDEIIVKKIDHLLTVKYDGNLVELIINTTQQELILEPLIDYIDGRPITVFVKNAVYNKYRKYRVFGMVYRYIELKGLEKNFEDLRPYHFNKATPGTYQNSKFLDEVIVKKIDQLLDDKYQGDLVSLIKGTTHYELNEPLFDCLDGRQITVSMSRPCSKAGARQYSPYDVVSRYIKVKGLTKFNNLKPYHFTVSAQGTSHNQKMVDEILVKKLDQLLETKYGGNLSRLIKNTNARELLSPFTDYLDGQPMEGSMAVVIFKFGGSPHNILFQYIKLKGWEEKPGAKSIIDACIKKAMGR